MAKQMGPRLRREDAQRRYAVNEPEVFRYGVGNREMTMHPLGKYLSVQEVKKYLQWCLYNDQETVQRLEKFEENL